MSSARTKVEAAQERVPLGSESAAHVMNENLKVHKFLQTSLIIDSYTWLWWFLQRELHLLPVYGYRRSRSLQDKDLQVQLQHLSAKARLQLFHDYWPVHSPSKTYIQEHAIFFLFFTNKLVPDLLDQDPRRSPEHWRHHSQCQHEMPHRRVQRHQSWWNRPSPNLRGQHRRTQ